jgi:hypothetical protein
MWNAKDNRVTEEEVAKNLWPERKDGLTKVMEVANKIGEHADSQPDTPQFVAAQKKVAAALYTARTEYFQETNRRVAEVLIKAANVLSPKIKAAVVSAWLEPTDEVIFSMKKFFEHKWKTEKGRPDLTGACVFATAFAAEILGGTPTGNWHHIYLDWFGSKKVDLTEAYGVREQAFERLEKQKEYEEKGYGALARAMTPLGFVGPDVDPHMVDKRFLRSADFKETWDSVQARATRWAEEFLEEQSKKTSSSRKRRSRIT